MSELRKADTCHPYFLTFTIVGWIDVFSREEYKEILVESLKFCQKFKSLEIFAYVIMTNHMHLVARSLQGNLNHIIRDYKSFTAGKILQAIKRHPQESRKRWMLNLFAQSAKNRRQNKKYQFWQKTNHPIELSNPVIFDQKVEYVHDNPVAAGFVIRPEDWFYSSANVMSPVEMDEW